MGSKAVLRLFVFVAVVAVAAVLFGKLLLLVTAASAPAASEEKLLQDREGYFILNFSEPVRQEFKDILSSLGVKLVYYVPENAYIAKLRGSSLERAKRLWFIKSAAPYSQGGKVQWRLRAVPREGSAVSALSPFGNETFDVVFFPGEKPDLEALRSFAGVVSSSGRVVRVSAPSAAADAIAALEGVEVVEPFIQPVVFNDNAARVMEAGTVWNAYLLNGSGQVVAVADTGLDNGTDNLSVIGDMNRDFDQRVLNIQNFYGTSPDDVFGHGTHVAGSAAGNGSNSNGTYKGIAWGANLVIQAMNDDQGSNAVFPPDDLNDLFATAYASANGSARIHTNSWGASTNTYASDSNQIDTFAWNYKNMTILFAAGNSGAGGSDGSGGTNKTVGTQANSKNAIVVGALENNRSGLGGDADNTAQVAKFSSRGTAADGRVKPDLVAPGTYIISSLSIKSGNDPCGYGNVDANYAYCSGTSMATPLVAGAVAVVRQYYTQNRSEVNPSSALIKATLINGAVDVGYGIPHNYTGWGMVNLTNTLFPPAPRKFSYVDNQSGMNTSDLVNYTFVVSNSTVRFKATLVWADYPAAAGTGSGKALVNNLDLIVSSPNGSHYFGNDFLSPFNDTRDTINNVEQVIIASPFSGTYIVSVNGSSVPQNPQPFAIVASGGLGNNTAPNITSFSPSAINVNIAEPANQTFNLTYSDTENDVVTVDWYVNGTIQAAARNTNFTFLGNFTQAAQQRNGTYNITAVLSDSSLATQINWTLIVNNTNRAPVWAGVANQTAAEDMPLNFTIVAADLDNDSITYFINNTVNFTINATAGNITFNLSGAGNFSGTFYLALNASDGLANVSEVIFVNVTAVNDTPTLFPLPNITVNESDFVNITAVADDAENDLLNFTVNDTLRLNFTTGNQSAANFSWKTNLTDSGTYQFKVNVTDFGTSSVGFFNVTVIDRADFDGDGIPDIYDGDDDNDGVPDDEDSITGNITSINSSTLAAAAFNVTVNGTANMSRLLNGTFFVNITNGSRSLVALYWNFSLGNLSLNFTIDVQNATAPFGGVVVKGLRLQQNQTKNITINNVNGTINSTCIKDADVQSFSNISFSCNGANETLVQCPGVSGSYNCSLISNNQFYMITGANFTAAKEQCADSDADGYYVSGCGSGNDCDDSSAGTNPGASDTCGNGVDEDCSGSDAVCPSLQVSGGGGGGGGGGGSAAAGTGGSLAKASQVFTAVKEGETAIMRINRSAIAFTKVRFTAASSLSNINVDVELLNESNVSARLFIPETVFFVYQYLSITTKLTFLDISSAAVEFRVPRQWLSDRGMNAKQVSLFRHSAGSWDRMRAVLFGEDSSYYYYSADLPAFSLFAVAAEKLGEGEKPAAEEPRRMPPNATEAKPADQTVVLLPKESLFESLFSEKKFKLVAAAVAVVFVLFAALFLKTFRKMREQEKVSDFVSRTR